VLRFVLIVLIFGVAQAQKTAFTSLSDVTGDIVVTLSL